MTVPQPVTHAQPAQEARLPEEPQRVGWYLHHHGQGHLQRLRAIAPHLGLPLTVFSSLPKPDPAQAPELASAEWVLLPEDWRPEAGVPDPSLASPTAGGALHWAPLGHRGYQDRMRLIADRAPQLLGMVVDVSAEVVAFSRLLGLPTAAVTQPGERVDAPHRTAYSLADLILAPFPEGDHPHLADVRAKTVFTGGISLLAPYRSERENDDAAPLVVGLVGSRGGSAGTAERVRDLVETVTRTESGRPVEWRVVGVPGWPWAGSVAEFLGETDVAVINGGLGSVADAAVLRTRALVLPQERPFREQEATAQLLAERGIPVASAWPELEDWPRLLDEAARMDPAAWSGWHADGAPARAAAALRQRFRPERPLHVTGQQKTGQPEEPRVVVVTMTDEGRLGHVRRQAQALAEHSAAGRGPQAEHVLVWLGDPAAAEGPDAGEALGLPGTAVVALDSEHGHRREDEGIPLAAGRNAGARAAVERGADLIVFLDADCIPGPDLLAAYADQWRAHPEALLAGPVTYLTADETRQDLAGIYASVHPHPARPAPALGESIAVSSAGPRSDYDLFWSLSFALTPATFERIGGFCLEYSGYGGEDTDFAYAARAAGVDLLWVGGAHAFHQHHPVSSPPVEHLDEILVNARVFRRRWGQWPMLGWLEKFEAMGLVEREPDGWVRLPRKALS